MNAKGGDESRTDKNCLGQLADSSEATATIVQRIDRRVDNRPPLEE